MASTRVASKIMADSFCRFRELPELPVDNTLVAAATVALQGHEKLASAMRKKLSENPSASKGTYLCV